MADISEQQEQKEVRISRLDEQGLQQKIKADAEKLKLMIGEKLKEIDAVIDDLVPFRQQGTEERCRGFRHKLNSNEISDSDTVYDVVESVRDICFAFEKFSNMYLRLLQQDKKISKLYFDDITLTNSLNSKKPIKGNDNDKILSLDDFNILVELTKFGETKQSDITLSFRNTVNSVLSLIEKLIELMEKYFSCSKNWLLEYNQTKIGNNVKPGYDQLVMFLEWIEQNASYFILLNQFLGSYVDSDQYKQKSVAWKQVDNINKRKTIIKELRTALEVTTTSKTQQKMTLPPPENDNKGCIIS